MKKVHKQWLIAIAVLVVVGGAIGFWVSYQNKPDRLDTFASCLKDSGATFYGAFWCPHCQNQKAMFGRSARLLPYVECSLPSGTAQNDFCNQKDIQSYPTWEFADGSRVTGEVPLQTLAEKTNCTLPASQ